MATVASITKKGWERLLSKGLASPEGIKLWTINDYTTNYQVVSNEGLVPKASGSHNQITIAQCAMADYNGVFAVPPSKSEIESILSNVQYNVVNEDCAEPFDLPNLNVNIHLNSWLTQLSNQTTYNFNMQGTVLNLWDFITAQIKTLDYTTSNYKTVKYIDNLNLTWATVSKSDLDNLMLFSPKFIQVQGNQKSLVDNTGVKAASPFDFMFSSYSYNGTSVKGSSGNIVLAPTSWGYLVNGNEFLTCTEVETSPESYETIQPAATVGTSVYALSEAVEYPTSKGFVGYAVNMYNKDNVEETLMKGLVNQAKYFIKSYFKYDVNNNIYTLPINFRLIATNPNINSINEKNGGNISITLIYDESVNNITNPIEIL